MSVCTQCKYTYAVLEKKKRRTLPENFSKDQKYGDKLGILEQKMEAMYIKSWVESKIDKSSPDTWARYLEEVALFGCFH